MPVGKNGSDNNRLKMVYNMCVHVLVHGETNPG